MNILLGGRTRVSDVLHVWRRVLRKEWLAIRCHSRLRAGHSTVAIGTLVSERKPPQWYSDGR